MNIKLSDTIEEIKGKYEEMSNMPEEEQRLIYSHKQLQDNLTLLDYNIKNGSILDVVIKLKGGGAIDNLIDYENKFIGFDLDLIERNELYITFFFLVEMTESSQHLLIYKFFNF